MEKINEERNVLLITCYEKPYSKRSLKMIKGIIDKERPSKIIILKIIEEPKVPDMASSRIGGKAEDDFLQSVVNNKKEKVDEYTDKILEMTDKTDIPTEVRLRKAELIADEIVKDYNKMEIDHLIIHDTDRDLLERLRRGKIEDTVEEEVDSKDITMV
ncbi:MAG: hypothetical protein KGY76_04410 [Candidatus Thermoplasmatota archaeon]|nr:hypothetical protein [Candidatus Thermoplasmatota archaeon]